MTITSTDTVERYVGDGSQTVWPITFPFFEGEDVKACIVNSSGEQVNLVYGTEYTVTKSTSSIGGTLNYALADGVKLTIWLNLPITQEMDFYNTGPLNAEILENAFDRLTLIAQQLQEASVRSIKVEASSSATPEDLLATLYAGRDAAVASASAAASSESNAAASEQAAASSESAAAGSASAAEAWAESETAPDPDDAESKSAKAWALIASDNVPIATATLAGKAKASASWHVDADTGEATVPAATLELAGIARKATDEEAVAGENDDTFMTPFDVKTVIDACRASTDDVEDGTSTTKFPSVAQVANVDLSNASDIGKANSVRWGGISDVYIEIAYSSATQGFYQAPAHGYIWLIAQNSLSSSVGAINLYLYKNIENYNDDEAILNLMHRNTSNQSLLLPVQKGNCVKITPGTGGSVNQPQYKFIYAIGCEPTVEGEE